jgi:periplasmic copper chaperone A
MRRRAAFFLACALSAAACGQALAHEYRAGGMLVVHPWLAATDATATEAAAFLTLKNQGSEPDRLVSVFVPGAASFKFEATETGEPLKGEPAKALAVQPAGKIKLKPGTGYILLQGIKGPVREGHMIEGTVTFEKAGTIPVGFWVQDASSTAATCASNPDGE